MEGTGRSNLPCILCRIPKLPTCKCNTNVQSTRASGTDMLITCDNISMFPYRKLTQGKAPTSLSWAPTTITWRENAFNSIIACRFIVLDNLTPGLASEAWINLEGITLDESMTNLWESAQIGGHRPGHKAHAESIVIYWTMYVVLNFVFTLLESSGFNVIFVCQLRDILNFHWEKVSCLWHYCAQ